VLDGLIETKTVEMNVELDTVITADTRRIVDSTNVMDGLDATWPAVEETGTEELEGLGDDWLEVDTPVDASAAPIVATGVPSFKFGLFSMFFPQQLTEPSPLQQ